MSDSSNKLSSFFAKKQGKAKFKAVKINLSSVSAVRMDEEDELDAQASLEANPRAAELISSAGWVADVDSNVGPVVHAGSKTVVGFSAAGDGEASDEDEERREVQKGRAEDDNIILHPMDQETLEEDSDEDSDNEDEDAGESNAKASTSALPAKFSKKSGWGVPAATPAASKTEELSKSMFPTLAAAKAVADAQAEAGGNDGFNVVGGSRRARRGPASMSSSGGPPSRSSYSDRRGGSGGVSRGGWTDTRPDHLRLKTSNPYDMLS